MTWLEQGDSGPMVRLLQKALTRAGYYNEPIDGSFGSKTKNAVRSFQRAGGLRQDGIAGGETWKALAPYLNRAAQYTARPGDTLSSIAQSYSVTVPDILSANPLLMEEYALFPGQRLTVPFPGSVINVDIPYSSGVMETDLAALQVRYSFLEVKSLGESVLNASIPYIRLGIGRKRIMYNASHHANEWITTPAMMRFLEMLCGALVANGALNGIPVRTLLADTSLYLVPMVNPDGVDLVTGQLQPYTEAYRQAYAMRGGLPFPSSWKANIHGVDLNNNYPALFEQGKAEKEALGINRPGPRDYTGPYPLSEPESGGMAALTVSLEPRLAIALHTQGEEIYWRFNDIVPPDGLRIGERMAEVSGYTLADPPGNSYGGYKDWFIQNYNLPGYTVELGEGVNPLPLTEFESVYRAAESIMLTGITEAT